MPHVVANEQSELDLFVSNPPRLTRRFLGWEAPLLDLATAALAEDWKDGPLDLSKALVVVPTRNASRRLRERLAIEAARRDTGVLPPLILNPDDLLLPPAGALPPASKAQVLATWIETLLNADLTNLQNLLPVPPVEQNFSWALATAKEFASVQSLLGEGAHNASYASKVLGNQDLETERWEEFARLERLTSGKLEKTGCQARATGRRLAIDSWQPPVGIARFILLGLPDPPPALEPLIERVALSREIEIWIHAPESEARNFDSFGQPAENWNNRLLPVRDDSIFQCHSPTGQAARACERLQKHESPHQVAAIGVPDPEVVEPLQKSLASHNLTSFDPAGKPLVQEGLCHLLRTLRDLANTGLMITLRELLRVPGVPEAAGSFHIPEDQNAFPPDLILEAFDHFHEKHLCETLSDTRAIIDSIEQYRAPIIRTLQWVSHHLDNLRKNTLAQVLPAFLNEIYQKVEITDQEHFSTLIQTLNQVLAEVDDLTFGEHSGSELYQLFLTLLEEQVLASRRPPQAIELPGWLELPWEDAPHLVLTGCNDGLVPESIQSHPWLPNQARILLGLRHNGTRQARDTYLMAALIASREKGGQVDFLFGRVNEKNDPLRPSRMLLATPPQSLPRRVDLLFQESENDTIPLPWNLAWQLTPPRPDPERFRKLSVTSFSKYLDCPFRYYLEFGLKMRQPDLDRMELNARDFGTITHDVLEDFAATTAADSQDEKEIRECFQDLLTTRLAGTYGTNLSAPLLIQATSIRQRLNWWAAHEARQRAEGWTILETETNLAPTGSPFLLGGLEIRGMIDRIETHPDFGLRILDFKTKKKPQPVVKAHLRAPKRSEIPGGFPSWRLVEVGGKALCWTNLQIPLYLLALAERFPDQAAVSGYVQLGATKGDIRLELWDGLEDKLLESARDCALGVIESIRNHMFWPPNEKPDYDNFAELLFGDPRSAINSQNLSPETDA